MHGDTEAVGSSCSLGRMGLAPEFAICDLKWMLYKSPAGITKSQWEAKHIHKMLFSPNLFSSGISLAITLAFLNDVKLRISGVISSSVSYFQGKVAFLWVQWCWPSKSMPELHRRSIRPFPQYS